jgi:hypothetical protein
MGYPTLLGVAALVALSLASPAYAFDETKYPDRISIWFSKPLAIKQPPIDPWF